MVLPHINVSTHERKSSMDKKQVEDMVERVRVYAADNPWAASVLENTVHVSVLRTIAHGHENAQELAQAVLKTLEIEFPRW